MANMIDVTLVFKGEIENLKRLRKDLCHVNHVEMPGKGFSTGWLGKLYYLNEKCSLEELKALKGCDSFLVSCRPIIGDEFIVETEDKWTLQDTIYDYLAEEYGVSYESEFDEEALLFSYEKN